MVIPNIVMKFSNIDIIFDTLDILDMSSAHVKVVDPILGPI